MKREIFHATFISTILLFLGLTPSFMSAQTREKIYSKVYQADKTSSVWITHQRGLLHVEKSTDGQLHVELKVRVTGKNQEDIDLLFKAIEIEENNSNHEYRLKTASKITSWSEVSGKTKVILKSGEVLHGLQDLEMVMKVKIPALNFLELANKYEKIEVADQLAFHVSIDIYSGEVTMKDIAGDLDLKSKYSTLEFGDFENGDFDLYESRVSGGKAQQTSIDSKYSTINLGSATNLAIISYEDKYTLADQKGTLKIDDKYSDFAMNNIENAELNLYESDFKFEQGQNLKVNSKYGEVAGKQLSICEISESYETDFEFESLKDLVVNQDKYGSFKVGLLKQKIKLSGYESDVEIKNVESSFSEIWIDSKYDRMRFGLPSGLKYSLDADLKYGSVTYHEEAFGAISKSEKNDNLVIKAGQESTAKVFLRGYETDFVLK